MIEAFRVSKLSAVLIPLLVAATTALFASDADRIHEENDIREAELSGSYVPTALSLSPRICLNLKLPEMRRA
jgi:hypothetical protein